MAVEIDNQQLVFEYDHYVEQARYFTEKAKEIREQLESLAGEDGELTLNGKPAFTNAYINRYQSERFKKENPELAEEFTMTVTDEVINWPKIKQMSPSLARKYQSRSFKRVQ